MCLLKKIAVKIHANQPLDSFDALALFRSDDLLGIGELASLVNRKKNGFVVWFNEHRYIRTKVDQKSPCQSTWALRLSSATYASRLTDRIGDLISPTTTEIRFGSVNPNELPFELLLEAIEQVRKTFPNIQIRALSAFNIFTYSQLTGLDIRRIVTDIYHAGVSYLDCRGNNAYGLELPSMMGLLPMEGWLAVHKAAHEVGLYSSAAMLYGYGESYEQRVAFLEKLRQAQDVTGGFLSFVPLGNQRERGREHLTYGADDLKTIAISRLYLDNFRNIGAIWGRLGINIAQLAICFGANDLEGTVSNDNNSRVAGARPFRSMNRNEITSLVKKAERNVQERDIFFKAIRKDDTPSTEKDESLGDRDAMARQILGRNIRSHLTCDEVSFLANSAPLLEMGSRAFDYKKNLTDPKQVGCLVGSYEIPIELLAHPKQAYTITRNYLRHNHLVESLCPVISIDLGKDADSRVRLADIISYLSSVSQEDQNLQIVIKGIKGIWKMAHSIRSPLIEVLQQLKEVNVTSIESSGFESEDDLTITEISTMHRFIHDVDITSVAKVELAAPYNGTEKPFWEPFIERLQALMAVQESTHGLLGIMVEAAKGSVISPVEYLRALAIVRIFVRNVPNIVAPFPKIPSFVRRQHLNITGFRDILKMAPICMFFGANDLGFVTDEGETIAMVRSEIQRSGFELSIRNARFYSQ